MNRKLFALLLLALSPAGATAIYDNLGLASNGAESVGNLTDLDFDWANEFESPSASNLTLTDVIAVLDQGTTASSVTADLYTNSGGLPGTLISTIATVTSSSIPVGTRGDVTFTAGTTITLAPSTQYWIVLIGASTGNGNYANWQVAGTDSGNEVGENHAFWTGSEWTQRSNSVYSAEIPQMEVDAASAAPEPATLGLIGLSLIGFAAIRRVRR